MPRVPLAAVVVVAAAGCGGAAGSRPAVHPVAGRVEVCDRPAAGAHVAFLRLPLDADVARGACPSGVCRPDGTFALTTYAAGDGAPAGEYVVTVVWPNDALPADECNCPDPAAHDRLYGLYADARTSALRATVRVGANEVALRPAVGGRGWNLPPLAAAVRPPPGREGIAADARARAERERHGPAGAPPR